MAAPCTRAFTLFALCLAFAPMAATAQPAAPPADVSPALEIVVDPRIELVAAVSALAGERPGWTPRETSPYREAMLAWAKPHARHPAVARMRAMEGFAYSYPAEAILHFGPPPALRPVSPVPAHVLEEIGGQQALDAWVASLRAFARDARFMAFFEAQAPARDAMVARVRDALAGRDIVTPFAAFHGLPAQRYTMVLGPNLLPGAFGPGVRDADGVLHMYSVQGPAGMEGETLSFGHVAALTSLTWHEWGHSVVNPLNAAARDGLHDSVAIFDRSADELRAMAYTDWPTAANELIVRANTVTLCRTVFRANDAAVCTDSQRTPSLRFNYDVYRLADFRITLLAHGRERWPRYADFHPIDLKILALLAQEP